MLFSDACLFYIREKSWYLYYQVNFEVSEVKHNEVSFLHTWILMGSLCVGGEGGLSVWWVCGGIKVCSMCSREDFCSKWSYGHSGIQADRDSTLFSIDINQMDISHAV